MLVIVTKYKDVYDMAACLDWFMCVVKQTDTMHSVPVSAIIGVVHLVRENAASGRIDRV
jgi:hypothetical protein